MSDQCNSVSMETLTFVILQNVFLRKKYLSSCFSPVLYSTLCMDAVGLGGSGGFEGKYVKNNRKQNTAKPNSENNKKLQMATL